jgi:two-component system response regulator RegA
MELAPEGAPRLELLQSVRKRWSGARIIVATAYPSVSVAATALRAGADEYMAKPVSPAEVASMLDGEKKTEAPRAHLPSLGRVEWEYIHRVLTHTGGNISEAARILGVERSTLQRKLRKLPARR